MYALVLAFYAVYDRAIGIFVKVKCVFVVLKSLILLFARVITLIVFKCRQIQFYDC